MKYDPISIILGIFILMALSYTAIFAYTLFYLKVVLKNKEINWPKMLLSVLCISLGWMGATVISIWLSASINVWVFAAVSFGVLLLVFHLLSDKLFGISGWHRLFYPIVLAVILNPVWFVLLGAAR
jgi:hypothetical protein